MIVGWEIDAKPSFTITVPQSEHNVSRRQGKARLAAVLMVRDEAKRVDATLRSAIEICDCLVLLDTGSQDDTIGIVERFCKAADWPLHLFERPFDDFSRSRNFLLEQAKSHGDFFLLLDCNDRLHNAAALRALVDADFASDRGLPSAAPPQHVGVMNQLNKQRSGLTVQEFQTWQKDHGERLLQTAHWWPRHYFVDVEYQLGNGVTRREPMVRLIRNGCGWRYSGPVHEVLWNDDWWLLQRARIDPQRCFIVQDKTVDDRGSERRWPRDLQLLQNYLQTHPEHPRALYYSAKTLRAMQKFAEAAHFYGRRYNVTVKSDQKDLEPLETFNAVYGYAECKLIAEKDSLSVESQKAIESAAWSAFRLQQRVEPLLLLHRLHEARGEHYSALMVAQLAVRMRYPTESMSLVDYTAYVDERYARYASSLLRFNQWAEAIAVLQSVTSQQGGEQRQQCLNLLRRVDATRQLQSNNSLRSAIDEQAKQLTSLPITPLYQKLPFYSTPGEPLPLVALSNTAPHDAPAVGVQQRAATSQRSTPQTIAAKATKQRKPVGAPNISVVQQRIAQAMKK